MSTPHSAPSRPTDAATSVEPVAPGVLRIRRSCPPPQTGGAVVVGGWLVVFLAEAPPCWHGCGDVLICPPTTDPDRATRHSRAALATFTGAAIAVTAWPGGSVAVTRHAHPAILRHPTPNDTDLAAWAGVLGVWLADGVLQGLQS